VSGRAVPHFGMSTGSYLSERDDWQRAVGRARREGWPYVELGALLDPLLATLPAYLEAYGDVIAGFDRVSLHAPVAPASTAATARAIAALPLDGDVIFHPDTWCDEAALAYLAGRVVFENMDAAKDFGREGPDLRAVFARYPDAGFCLDVAHVWTNDPTLGLGHELLDAFGDRLRQLHVSGIERDGAHRPTTPGDLELYRPLLDRCATVPWILEAELAG
jgi:sugar phosphate isomerase/epimerase